MVNNGRVSRNSTFRPHRKGSDHVVIFKTEKSEANTKTKNFRESLGGYATGIVAQRYGLHIS